MVPALRIRESATPPPLFESTLRGWVGIELKYTQINLIDHWMDLFVYINYPVDAYLMTTLPEHIID